MLYCNVMYNTAYSFLLKNSVFYVRVEYYPALNISFMPPIEPIRLAAS